MAKYSLGSTTIPTKKIKQFISDVGLLIICYFLLFFPPLLKLIPFLSPLFHAPMAEDQRIRYEPPEEEEEEEEEEELNEIECEYFEDLDPVAVQIPGLGDKSTIDQFGEFHGEFGVVADHNKATEVRSSSQQPMIGRTVSDLGSMRSDKEWSRTLECMILQERHNVIDGGGGGGGEGMDMLWEVYERTEEDGKQRERCNEKEEEKGKKNKNRIVDYLEELEEEEGGEVGSNLCCLKALKFGIARPGFLKFSKAFKGMRAGWLNHHHHLKKKKNKNKKSL